MFPLEQQNKIIKIIKYLESIGEFSAAEALRTKLNLEKPEEQKTDIEKITENI